MTTHRPDTVQVAAFLGVTWERANEIPYDILRAVDAARERCEAEKHEAYNCGFIQGTEVGKAEDEG